MASMSWEAARAAESAENAHTPKAKSNRQSAILAHLQAARAAKSTKASRPIPMPAGFKVDEFNNFVRPEDEDSLESDEDSEPAACVDSGYDSTCKPAKLSRGRAVLASAPAPASKKPKYKKQPLVISAASVVRFSHSKASSRPKSKPKPKPRASELDPPQALWVDERAPESRRERSARLRHEGTERRRRMRMRAKSRRELEGGEVDEQAGGCQGPAIRRLLLEY